MSKKKKKPAKTFEDTLSDPIKEDIEVKEENSFEEETKPVVKAEIVPEKTLTMGEFLSTSREIKQRFNSYVIVGFKRHYEKMRLNDPRYSYRKAYDDWMKLFLEYAET